MAAAVPRAVAAAALNHACRGGDAACHQQAEKDGYVAVSLYAFCRREEVHTVPRPAGAALLVALLAVVGVVLWRVRRARTF
jgi:hypothetical protein